MSEITASLIGSAAALSTAVWDRLANPNSAKLPHPFTRHAFLVALEQSGSATGKTGWTPAHLVLSRGEDPVALVPLYRKSHSYGEYVFDQSWASAFAHAGGRYYPKLQASVPFTPVTGPRLMVAAGEDRTALRRTILEFAALAVEETDTSSLHITFMPEDDWRAAGEHGFLLRTDQQFHWDNRLYGCFDDFLKDLHAGKRKTVRKERAAVAASGIAIDWLTGADLTEEIWDSFFACYTATGSTKWNPPYLTRDFFSRIGASMGEQILLIRARQDGRTIAGALNFFDDTTLYGRNWGAIADVPFLHFEACYYQAIDFAITRKLLRVEAGAQGGHKLLRGYLPRPTYSAHHIAHAGLAKAVAEYLAQERHAVREHMQELAEQAPFRKNG